MVKYILPHTSLTNNWFAPPRITELVLKSGRHEKAIRLCLVPYFRSPKAYCHHTFLPSSVRYWLSILLLIQFQYFHYTPACTSCKEAHTATIYRIKPMILCRSTAPFCVSVKLDYFFHIILRFLLFHFHHLLLNSYPPHRQSKIYAVVVVHYQTPLPCLIV